MPLDTDAPIRLKKDGTPRLGKGGRNDGQTNRKDLNAKQVDALKRDARVSKNLLLQVAPGGSKSWLMEWAANGKRCWMGLGSYPAVSLADARTKVEDARRKLAAGTDPRTPIVTHRFIDVVPYWVAKEQPTWTSARYAKGVVNEIAKWTDETLGDLDVAQIDTPDVEAALMQLTENDHPLWFDKHVTAVRLRGYIEQVLGYAMAKRWRQPGFNCAVWKDNLSHLLADPKGIHKPEPHASLHPDEIAGFMATLRTMDGLAYRALEALIMCGLRTNEAVGAHWSEINLDTGRWSVPGSRMKKRLPHSVPLPAQAVALFQALPRTGSLVFGDLDPDALRDALPEVMSRAGREWVDRSSRKLIVPHGFRASMATWAADANFEDGLIDVSLAHAVGSEVLRRYQRSDKIELRRTMMQQWADHLAA